jgi:hypothetical protein
VFLVGWMGGSYSVCPTLGTRPHHGIVSYSGFCEHACLASRASCRVARSHSRPGQASRGPSPVLRRSTGDGPVSAPPSSRGCGAVHTRPGPVEFTGRVQLREQDAVQFVEDASLLPPLQPAPAGLPGVKPQLQRQQLPGYVVVQDVRPKHPTGHASPGHFNKIALRALRYHEASGMDTPGVSSRPPCCTKKAEIYFPSPPLKACTPRSWGTGVHRRPSSTLARHWAAATHILPLKGELMSEDSP